MPYLHGSLIIIRFLVCISPIPLLKAANLRSHAILSSVWSLTGAPVFQGNGLKNEQGCCLIASRIQRQLHLSSQY